jgi:hypothetical protein
VKELKLAVFLRVFYFALKGDSGVGVQRTESLHGDEQYLI